ncbi:5E5 antigen-like [Phyllostomus hastatus]|uniref:5E5 antigen-like n=1 Tax=Phyllostomus hastatus TaxID=9423 RepID=UPI001E6843D3|nr:5E5 antigen-like [Phyllostomus hastatus]
MASVLVVSLPPAVVNRLASPASSFRRPLLSREGEVKPEKTPGFGPPVTTKPSSASSQRQGHRTCQTIHGVLGSPQPGKLPGRPAGPPPSHPAGLLGSSATKDGGGGSLEKWDPPLRLPFSAQGLHAPTCSQTGPRAGVGLLTANQVTGNQQRVMQGHRPRALRQEHCPLALGTCASRTFLLISSKCSSFIFRLTQQKHGPGSHWPAPCPPAGLPCAGAHRPAGRPLGVASGSAPWLRGWTTRRESELRCLPGPGDPSLPKRRRPREQTSELVNGRSAEELQGLGPRLQSPGAEPENQAAEAWRGRGAGAGRGQRRRRASASGSFRLAVSSGGLLGGEEKSACTARCSGPAAGPLSALSGSRRNTWACRNPEHRAPRASVGRHSRGRGHGGRGGATEGGAGARRRPRWFPARSAASLRQAQPRPSLPPVGAARGRRVSSEGRLGCVGLPPPHRRTC